MSSSQRQSLHSLPAPRRSSSTWSIKTTRASGARVSVVNTSTGELRETVSGNDGSATIPALSITGAYTVRVSKQGFGDEERKDITLRSSEAATLKVTLLVGAEKAEVTVYGTAEGIHANPQIVLPLRSAQTVGQSRASDIFSHQVQFSDTLSWSLGKHYLRFGGSVIHHTSGGTGSEPGTAILGTFTFRNTTTAPLDQLFQLQARFIF